MVAVLVIAIEKNCKEGKYKRKRSGEIILESADAGKAKNKSKDGP